MAFQLIERPHKFSFADNPIRYVFEVSNPDTPGSAMEIELYTLGIDAGVPMPGFLGNLVTRQTLTPNPDGKVYFYCEDYLNSQLEWELPSLATNNIVAVKKQICKYYIRYRQITQASPTPAWVSDSGHLKIALKGGIAKEKFDRNNFFINYLPEKKPFLTWQPADHMIGLNERRYLTYLFIHPLEGGFDIPVLFLRARVVYTDGSTDMAEQQLPPFTESILFHLPAGLQQLGLYNLQPGKQIWYYDVSVEDMFSSTFAAPYRLCADYNHYYHAFSFHYHNSQGGFDALRIRGEWDHEVNLDGTDIQKAIAYNEGDILPTEVGSINKSKYDVFKGDAGWFNSKEMQDSIQEMLLSDSVYRVMPGAGDRWMPVVNLQKTQPMGGTEDTKWSFPLQWRYTFNNSKYTPAELDFGKGSNNEPAGPLYGTCTAPSGLLVELLFPEGAGLRYRFSWDEAHYAEEYQFEWKEENDTDWTVQTVSGNEVQVVLTAEGEYSWRVRSRCGENDYSGYAAGQGFIIDFEDPSACTAPATTEILLKSIEGDDAFMELRWQQVTSFPDYVLEWREVGASNWNTAAVSNAQHGSQFTIRVKKSSQYEWRVRSRCGENDYSGYTYGKNFIAINLIGLCTPPANLQVVVHSFFDFMPPMAEFSWDRDPNNNNYELSWRIKDYPNWVTADNSTMAYVDRGKTYEWRVRTKCNGGGYSNYIYGPVFYT